MYQFVDCACIMLLKKNGKKKKKRVFTLCVRFLVQVALILDYYIFHFLLHHRKSSIFHDENVLNENNFK